jgi:hypothetical protein
VLWFWFEGAGVRGSGVASNRIGVI